MDGVEPILMLIVKLLKADILLLNPFDSECDVWMLGVATESKLKSNLFALEFAESLTSQTNIECSVLIRSNPAASYLKYTKLVV